MRDGTELRLNRVLETVLYCRSENHDEVMQFYDELLGLRESRLFTDQPGLYRLGATVLLVFNADETTVKKSPPPTGTIDEIEWSPPLTGRSFYFHDPAGNVLEIADGDIWPRA